MAEKREKVESELKAVKQLVEDGWTVEDSLDFVRDVKKSSSLLSGEGLEFDMLSDMLKKKLIRAMKEKWE